LVYNSVFGFENELKVRFLVLNHSFSVVVFLDLKKEIILINKNIIPIKKSKKAIIGIQPCGHAFELTI
jgi:hypothetical protein